MSKCILLFVAAMLLTLVTASEAHAWGACHVGYNHYGPVTGFSHYGATAVHGPYGGGYHSSAYHYGGYHYGGYSAGYYRRW